MKRAILFLALCAVPSAMAAQAPITQITGVTASREALRTQVNTRLAAAQSNFTEIYTALNGSPWLAQTTAPNIHNVFWIDTSGTSPAIKYWDGDSWEIAASGVDGTYTLPTASAETKGGVKIGARLTMTGDVLSADVQTTDISGKQDILVSGTNIKTVNGTSVLGSGNLVVGDGGGISHATSDGAYYASRNGAWSNLAGVFAAPLGSDDNYVTDAEKVKLGNLSGTNTGDQDLSGYALTSSVLSKTNTTAFTPTADYHPSTKKYVDDSIAASGGYTDEQSQDAAGAMFSGNTETGIAVTYDDATAKVSFVVGTLNQNTTGTAAGLTAQYIDWNAPSGGNSILNKPTISGSNTGDQTATTTAFTPNGTIAATNVQAAIQEVRDESGSATLPTAIEGQILQADSGGVYRSTSSFAGLINDAGVDTDDLWSASKITSMLGGKQDTLGANIYQAYDANMITWPIGVTATEIGYIDLTSSGQTQLNSKAPSIALEVDGSASTTLTAAQVSSTIIYNTGMGGADVALTFPAAAAGYAALFTVGTAQSFKWGVRAGASDKIFLLAADGTIAAGIDNGYARMTAAQIGQSFACWTIKTDAYDWLCKGISTGTSTFAAN